MATYQYKAKTSAGTLATGKLEASDMNMAVFQLRNKGLYPIEISPPSIFDMNLSFGGGDKQISLKELAVFCKQFHTIINAGVTIIDGLDLLRKQVENKRLAVVLNRIYEDIQKGMSLSEAMRLHKKVFPNIMPSMIEIGEISGNLDLVLERLAVFLEKDYKIKEKVKTSTVYPKVIGGIAFVVVAFMLTFVVPNFVSMFKSFGGTLPLPTRILIGISETLKNGWFLMGLTTAIILIVLIYRRFRQSDKGKFFIDYTMLRLPIVGKYVKKIIASRFARAMNLLLISGVPIIQALEVVGSLLNNVFVSDGLEKAKEEVRRGVALSRAIESLAIFPLMVIHMISVGEESGSLDEIVGKVADFYDDELDASVNRLVAMLEPLMIVGMAIVVGGIVIAMVMPIFSMYKGVGK